MNENVEQWIGGTQKPGQRKPHVSRFVGALVGGAAGDALGARLEGRSPHAIQALHGTVRDFIPWHGWKGGPRGTITDDTQLTMCVAESLLAHGFLHPDDLARRLVDWLPHGRGKGAATTKAVSRLTGGVHWSVAGEESAGNGAAMRSAPIGLARWNQPLLLRAEGILSALPTHRVPMAAAGAVAMAAATAFMVTRSAGGWTVPEFIEAVQRAIVGIEWEPLPERRDPHVLSTLHDRIGMLPDLLDWPPAEVFKRLYNGAYVLESVPSALYCFLRHRNDFEEMLVLAVNVGHDADTVGAMAGTLGGALHGVEGVPQRWLDDLEYREDLTELGQRLHVMAA